MAPVQFCLKVLGAWPENQTRLQRFISYLNYPVYKVSELSRKGCGLYEESHHVVHIRPSYFVWLPNIVLFAQLSVGFSGCIKSLLAEIEDRAPLIPLPNIVLRTNWIFYPLFLPFTVGHLSVWLTITSSDALIVSLSTTIREKAETLKNILSDFAKLQTHSEQDVELSKVIIYHNIIATIRNETEKLFSYSMLLQILFLVVSLGIPGVRWLFENTMRKEDVIFTMCYVIWVFSQLIVYCEMCEAATHSCTSLGFAAYSTYRPDMSPSVARKLLLIVARAQRPMDLTARKLIKINRETLLTICRRSYSLYSAIFNVK